MVSNNYGNGIDTLSNPYRVRLHTDNSIEVRYYDQPATSAFLKMAFSLTGDLGCEYGGGVTCHRGKGGRKQAFLGRMGYNQLVSSKFFRRYCRGGMMEQSGPLPDTAPAHQRCGRGLRFAVLHDESR